jgi:ligand-binding sensor domain-containing protein
MRITKKGEIIFLVVVSGILILSLSALITTISVSNAPPTATPTITLSPTASTTFTPTRLPTRTFTATYTSTTTFTPTRTNTITPTPSLTPLPSQTPTQFIFDQGVFERAFVINQVIPGIVNRMLVANDGSLWLASPYAVGRYEPESKKFSPVNLRDPVIGLTKDGKAWILPKSGSPLQAWDGQNFTNYDQTNNWLVTQGYGAPSPLDPELSYDFEKNLWITTADDVRRLRGTQWQIFVPQQMGIGLPNRKTISTSYLLAHSQVSNTTWVGSCDWQEGERIGGDGVRQFDGSRWMEVALPADKGCVTSMATDPNGYLWVGMDGALWRYDQKIDTWREFKPPILDPAAYVGFSHGAVLEIVVAPDKSIWVLYEFCGSAGCKTRQMRYRLQFGLWTAIHESSQISPPLLLFDGESVAWTLTTNEISRLEGTTFKPVAWMDWKTAAVDSQGTIWVLTGKLNAELILWRYPPE